MKAILIGISVLLAYAAAASAQSPIQSSDDLPTYEEVGLRWERPPSVRDMARQHQVSTRARGRRGMAEVACTPRVDGRLNCEVIYEDPDDLYFGRAALEVMRRVRVTSVDGYSPEGRTFGYRLRFGNWPESALPDRYHPVDQGLRWTRRPELAGLHPGGSFTGQEASARFDCVARADGSLDCVAAQDQVADRSFVRAGLLSLAEARVQRVDGGPLAGSPLTWTFRLVRHSNCAGGSGRTSDPDTGRGVASALDPASSYDAFGAEGAGGTQGSQPFTGSCMSAVVQMH
ncbi:hypothetical protein [Brevundimonas sp.]|uniref:hypothetical protein n=1 Tax=Brevundimonas sp. TaxID=1871086 RepID=UPI003918A8CA